MEGREIVSRWIEDRARERDAPALAWCLQRCISALMTAYPSATYEDNAAMILAHVKTVLGGEG